MMEWEHHDLKSLKKEREEVARTLADLGINVSHFSIPMGSSCRCVAADKCKEFLKSQDDSILRIIYYHGHDRMNREKNWSSSGEYIIGAFRCFLLRNFLLCTS